MNKTQRLFLLAGIVASFCASSLAQTTNTVTSVSSSANPSCLNQPVTFTAAVTSDPSLIGAPTGTIDFMDGATVLATTPLDGSGQATFTTSSLAAGPHSMTARYSGDTNFNASSSSILTETINTLAAITANPANRTVCAGNSASFTATASGSPPPSVQWQVSTDGGSTFTNVPNATNNTYTFATTASDNAKQFRAQFTNPCSVAASTPATLTVNPLPVCSISGADAVCASSANNVFTAPPGLAGYRWSLSGNATLTGATNAQSVSATAAASGTFTLTLWLTNSSGCISTCAKAVGIAAPPSGVVSGGGTICLGSSTNIQVVLTGTGPWTLLWSDGFTQTGVAASPAIRNVSPATTTTYSVTNVSDANCSRVGSGTATVTVNIAPAITANPTNRAVCAGNSASFTATASGSPAPTVQWQVSTDGGSTFTNVPNATNTTYTFATAAGDDAKQFRAQFANTCGLIASVPATLSVNPLPTCSISGADAVCASSSNNLYFAPSGLAGYRWSISGSATISGSTNSQSVTVNAGASGTFTVTLMLTNGSGCTSTCAKTVNLLALPTATVSGGGGICPGTSTNIQAALTGTGPWTLQWSDGFTQSGVAASPAIRSVSPATTTIYSVTTVADSNCSRAGSGSATVTINTAPAITTNPSNRTVCASNSVSFTSAASASPAATVQWQVSTDGGATFANIPGATSSTYTFTASLSDSGKNFRALFSNPCGSAVSSAAALVVNPLPSASITADSAVCGGSTGNAASVPSAGPGATYSWTVSGGSITSGAGTSAITYTAGTGGSITINVTVTSPQGCPVSSSRSVTLATQTKNLEGWKNKVPLVWQGSTFNNGDHQYSEGNSLPMRLELTQMCPGSTWCIVLRYDFKDANTSRHFYDFLGTYNASEPTVNGQECTGFNCSGSPTTFPIPVDPSLSYQLPGNFTVFGGIITNVSSYTTVTGSTVDKQLTISGITSPVGGVKDVLILFAGHLARENEYGPGNGASSFPGASAKVFYQSCGDSSFGNFGVNPGGIVQQADLSITKTAAPNPLCAGNTLTYTLVIANAGPNQASPVTVLDALPAGTTLNNINLSQGSYSGTSSLNLALGAINAGSNATATIVVTVDTNAVVGNITNTATVSAVSPADPYVANNTASAVTMVFPRPSATPLTDQVVCSGAPVTFSTSAIGAPPFVYRWMRNGAFLAGATNSSYAIPSATAADAGSYCVVVTCQCNGLTDTVTNCASLIISTNISVSPLASMVKCPGDTAVFSTTVSGTGPFSFVWKKDSVAIPGATLNTLTLANVTAANAGAYCVEVNGGCSGTSSCATLTVATNTTATALVSQTNCPGDTVTFTTVASGSGPFSYAWRKDGATLVGQTLNSLTLVSVSSANAGLYSVEVAGNCNIVTNFATLSVRTPISADPLVSQTNCPGGATIFSTTAHGDGPFSFQWTKNGALLAGRTDSSLTLTNLAAVDAGTYAVQVSSFCSSITNVATLAVNQSTLVATPPASLTNCAGTTAGFSVTAGGTGPFNYQWLKNGAALAGQTNSSLALPAITAADAGTYTVTVTGACGNSASADALLVVNQSAAVTTPPVSLTNCPGTPASFSVSATGTALTYQWFKGAIPLAGQTTSTLTLPTISANDAGAYRVVVQGACGNAITNSATLAVNQSLLVVTPPVSITNCPGTLANFSVTATGTALTYQWCKGATPLAGQTTSTLTLPAVSASDAGAYLVMVQGACGNTVTNSATLAVNQDLLVITPPTSLTNCPGTPASFNVNATGSALTYQWCKGTTPLAGQTTSTLTLPAVSASDAGAYLVMVQSACGNTVTNSANLAVNQNLLVVTPPASVTNCPGTPANFSVNATGTALTYQWFKGATPLAGQTTSTLTLPVVTANDAGAYLVVVQGACGNTVTNSATLTVNQNLLVVIPPANLTNCPGTPANFSVNATGTALTYQWFKGATLLAGQTANSLTLPAVTASDAGAYLVMVRGACGNTVTNSATLTVNQNLLVVTPPANLTNCPGTPANFTVNATGTALTYQWFKGASLLAGQAASTLALSAVTANDAGTYLVVVQGACGNSVTNSAILSVNTPVTADPLAAQTVCAGSTVTFTTIAHGTAPFSYRWLKDGTPISGQTTNFLVLSSPTAADSATYTVEVTGSCNTTTRSAVLTVNTPTTADPLGAQTVCPGAALSLNAVTHGTGPFTYQWVKDGKPLPGATTSAWAITKATVLDQGTYVVIVNGACTAVTNTGTVTVHPPTTATPLADQSLCFGATATFTTVAGGTGPFTYVWTKNGQVLPGQTANTLTIPRTKASDAATYSVQVSGLCDSVTNSATLAVASDGLVSPATFANPGLINVRDFDSATPYPSAIQVSCVPGPLTQLTVTLTNVSHTYASDLDILLVGPAGQAVMLMSDAGVGTAVVNANLSFSDAAPGLLPQTGPIVTGVYKPTNYPPDDNMPLPAPLGPYTNALAAFNGTDANGTWSLYVVDDALMDTGIISGGWSLTLAWDGPLGPFSLAAPRITTDGYCQMTLQAQVGKTFLIQASTDLLNWTPIATNTLSSPTWTFTDSSSGNIAKRFYRAVYQP
jgi:uncharacterized repeat protein (TIGR01451 family)